VGIGLTISYCTSQSGGAVRNPSAVASGLHLTIRCSRSTSSDGFLEGAATPWVRRSFEVRPISCNILSLCDRPGGWVTLFGIEPLLSSPRLPVVLFGSTEMLKVPPSNGILTLEWGVLGGRGGAGCRLKNSVQDAGKPRQTHPYIQYVTVRVLRSFENTTFR
jgi:hypothetical protein